MQIDHNKMLPVFVQTVQESMTVILQVFSNTTTGISLETLEEAHRYFHSTGTSAAMMQLPEVSQMSRNAEYECKDLIAKQMLPAKEQLEQLRAAAQAILDAVTAL